MAADAHSIDALRIVIATLRSLPDSTFIAPGYAGASFTLANADGRAITVTKLGLTKTTAETMGYTVEVAKPRGRSAKFAVWIMEPFRGNMVEYNRDALIWGLNEVIRDPNVGKQLWEISAKHVAMEVSRLRRR